MKIIRVTKESERAGAYYVRMAAMMRKYQIPLDAEIDAHESMRMTAKTVITFWRWTVFTRWRHAAGSNFAMALPKSGASWCCRNTGANI